MIRAAARKEYSGPELIKMHIKCFLAWGLLTMAPAWSQATQFNAVVRIQGGALGISSDGTALQFREAVCNSEKTQWVEAETCPAFLIVDASGTGRGWHVSVSVQDLTNARGDVIQGRQIYFSGRGAQAQLWGLSGDSPQSSGGPVESEARLPLGQAQVVSCRAGYGRGRYRWAPRPQQFLLELLPDTAPGNYQGQVTFTVLSRP